MPFPMRIQPIDAKGEAVARGDLAAKPAAKSRLKRLLERQFPSVLRISSSDKLAGACGDGREREPEDCEMEPSSVCLDRMVLSYIEESNGGKPSRCGRNRCNCFNGNCDDSSDDDLDLRPADAGDVPAAASGDAAEILKGMVMCASVAERNLLADASGIVESSKSAKAKEEYRRIVADGLRSLGYDASICKSRWEKTPSFPAGEYEYVDVVMDGGERLLVEVDLRSEFEIARSTKQYRAVLHSLPSVFVGGPDRLEKIVAFVSDAARQSLKKKGLHFPPWRKPEYMRAKWLSPYHRANPIKAKAESEIKKEAGGMAVAVEKAASPPCAISAVDFSGEFELRFEQSAIPAPDNSSVAGDKITVVVSRSPAVRLSASVAGGKVVTGLAAVL